MLTAEQAAHFVATGYLQLSQIVPPQTCRHLVSQTWASLPAHWVRDDSRTWGGEVADSCHSATLDARGGHLKFQVKPLADDPLVVSAFDPRSSVHQVAFELIGKPLHRIRLRGLYAIAPAYRAADLPLAPIPHIEAHPAQLIALCYLEDVEPGGGGLLVWPGSHRDSYRAFDSKMDCVVNANDRSTMDRYRGLAPLELRGARGDVVLIHHRLLHSPSINRSQRIRFGFLCDYTPIGFQELCRQAPGEQLWEDWPGLKAVAGPVPTAALCPQRMVGLGPVPETTSEAVSRPASAAENATATTQTPTSRNKTDASRLARMKRPGDIWLSVSDSPAWFDRSHSLDPQGTDIVADGVRAFLNGRKLASMSKGDITVRLGVQPGENQVAVQGADRRLWVRVIEIRLPFSESRVLYRKDFPAGPSTFSFTFSTHEGPDAERPNGVAPDLVQQWAGALWTAARMMASAEAAASSEPEAARAAQTAALVAELRALREQQRTQREEAQRRADQLEAKFESRLQAERDGLSAERQTQAASLATLLALVERLLQNRPVPNKRKRS